LSLCSFTPTLLLSPSRFSRFSPSSLPLLILTRISLLRHLRATSILALTSVHQLLPQPQHLQPPPQVGCSFFLPFFALASPCPPSLPSFVLVALARALSSRLVLSYSCALSRSLPS